MTTYIASTTVQASKTYRQCGGTAWHGSGQCSSCGAEVWSGGNCLAMIEIPPIEVCRRCVVEGRCIDGWVYCWSTLGEHKIECGCSCHV